MKTIRELAKEQLPKSIYKKFVRAVLEDKPCVDLDQKPLSPNAWLACSFRWSFSIEGHKYWSNINNKYVK